MPTTRIPRYPGDRFSPSAFQWQALDPTIRALGDGAVDRAVGDTQPNPKVITRLPGALIHEGNPTQRPAPAPLASPPPPPPDAAIPTWQSVFSDAERAGVTGQNEQGSLKPTTGGVDMASALGNAAKIFGQKKPEPKMEPMKFATPQPLRASPIQGQLPDPVLFALFGKPI